MITTRIVASFFVFTISQYVFAQETLLFAIDIVRHGDRTPIILSPAMQKIWPHGVGQLTPKGMRQAYAVGKSLRHRYIETSSLLPQTYHANTLRVRSSALPRTLMSAQAILYGMYPLGSGPLLADKKPALPQGFQPIPIQTVPYKQDSLLVPSHDKTRFNQLLKTYVFSTQAWIEKNKKLQSSYAKWSLLAGIPITNLFELISYSDRLMIECLYHIQPPIELSQKEVDTIIDAGCWAWLTIANNPTIATILGSELSQTIAHQLQLATQPDRPLKYFLLVAHDSTIATQLQLLGINTDHLPPYTAQLNYALFNEGHSHYQVRVTYNQKPLFIKLCGGTSCELNQFIALLAPTLK